MAQIENTTTCQTLTTTFPDEVLEKRAEEHGVIRRQRKLDAVCLFWTLVLGFTVGAKRTLTSLRRAYEDASGTTMAASSFYERFTPALARLMKSSAQELLGRMTQKTSGHLQDFMRGFDDILAMDATVIRLFRGLCNKFPACHDEEQAAMKLHAVMSVVDGSPNRIKLSGQRRADNAVWKKLGRWVEGCLMTFDLGYYDFNLFHRIECNGGYFLSRLKACSDPMLVGQHRKWRGRARPVVGRRLREAIDGMKRKVLDVEAQFEVPLQSGRTLLKTWRVVGLLNEETGEYHLYVTNVPSALLSAEDVGKLYALRWQVELLFKLLKSHARLHHLPSSKWHIAETLIWATIIQVLAAHLVRAVLLELAPPGRMIPPLRFQEVFATKARDILRTLTEQRRDRPIDLDSYLLRHAIDPNVIRSRSIDALFRCPHG